MGRHYDELANSDRSRRLNTKSSKFWCTEFWTRQDQEVVKTLKRSTLQGHPKSTNHIFKIEVEATGITITIHRLKLACTEATLRPVTTLSAKLHASNNYTGSFCTMSFRARFLYVMGYKYSGFASSTTHLTAEAENATRPISSIPHLNLDQQASFLLHTKPPGKQYRCPMQSIFAI